MPVDINSFANSARSIAGTAAGTLGTVVNAVNTLKTEGFGAALRSVNLIPGGETGTSFNPVSAIFGSSATRDWRVRLGLPLNATYLTSPLLSPLIQTNGLVFPYTPTITIAHSASYSPMNPVHNNYPFLSYENSKIDSIQVTAQFYIEDSVEAAYWIGAVHFLKSVTKMQFGRDTNAGAPPAVLKLNGYGDYMFKDIPVVVTNFQMDLPKDVDYIATGLARAQQQGKASDVATKNSTGSANAGQGVAWAPVKSTFTVTVQPLYSREQQRNFSLDQFVKGDYVLSSDKGTTGYI